MVTEGRDKVLSTAAAARRRKWSKAKEKQELGTTDGEQANGTSAGDSAPKKKDKKDKKAKKEDKKKKKKLGLNGVELGIKKKKRKRERKIELTSKQLRDQRREALYSEPDHARRSDALATLPPVHERSVFQHGLLALPLCEGDTVQRAMSDDERHTYLSRLAELSGQITSLLHDVVSATTKDNAPSVEEELLADMVKLKHVPVTKRYEQMTLWKRVARFQDDSLARVRELNYGMVKAKNTRQLQDDDAIANDRNNGKGKKANVVHESYSTDLKFNSFRDRYLSNILHNQQSDLEKIRKKEAMDIDQVKFLRQCLDSSASLYANMKCWDDEQYDKSASNSNA